MSESKSYVCPECGGEVTEREHNSWECNKCDFKTFARLSHHYEKESDVVRLKQVIEDQKIIIRDQAAEIKTLQQSLLVALAAQNH